MVFHAISLSENCAAHQIIVVSSESQSGSSERLARRSCCSVSGLGFPCGGIVDYMTIRIQIYTLIISLFIKVLLLLLNNRLQLKMGFKSLLFSAALVSTAFAEEPAYGQCKFCYLEFPLRS